MPLPIKISTTELAALIDEHLGVKNLDKNPSWKVLDSPISGRGVFASRDIAAGEIILRDVALLAGPKTNDTANVNTCALCCCHLEGNALDVMCKNGCTLPLCRTCASSNRHFDECELLKDWRPKDRNKINSHILRLISIVRCVFLQDQQQKLLNALQANSDKYYMVELQKAVACFENFPRHKEMLTCFYRTICAFNTNAFEGNCQTAEGEIRVRGLFPLAGLVNHKCTPNADHHFEDGQTIVLTATRAIRQGEEIFTSYTKLLWSNVMRKTFLMVTKKFMCSCPRCLDPTENGTYLSALFCRAQGCKSIVIPVQTKTLQPDWRCTTCESVFPHSKMARYQDFALNTINNRINKGSVAEMITFINDMCPRFCPSSNYVLVEAKLNVIWRMSRPTTEEFNEDHLKCKERYKEEIVALLEKLGAGDCTLKKLITEEIL
ncbi:SET domain-containing protein SmydA-8 isoform X2 [Stomoxys calcitrans]|uniref:SET domain-containing protein SmydA-8 isoform X2 n=1 Tax=Stomoxys calcitrans TaxID=35570 RepID=UPI0027E2207A|nr:SET domain-containing protein SmydA-8 isoform X2 [Stomoxys calcitrans]